MIGIIDYQGLLQSAVNQRVQVIEFLRGHLPYACRDAYIEMTAHCINIIRWHYGSFEYIFDDCASLELRGAVPEATDIEARLIRCWDAQTRNSVLGMTIA